MKCLISWEAILFIAILPGCSVRQEEPDRIAKGKALVEGDKEMIGFLAHPTATLQSAEYLNCADANGGFKLVYKFTYLSRFRKEPFDSTLGFVFDRDGRYQRSTVEATSSKSVNPYTAATQAIPALARLYAKVTLPDMKLDAQGVQDFILKNGGSRVVFRETWGSLPWNVKSPRKEG
jgi:hypothetical protein